jgi:phosphatidylethanolamine/phosphatidyl-N-methylethanolamine N-methyltransferase
MTPAYAKWAPIYDAIYSRLLRPAQSRAAAAALACGREILEVGVGTGLSLGDYPAGSSVIGIDLSKDMLDRAARKIADNDLQAIRGLAVMDACRLGFADASFDAVACQFVITLVPDPEAALDEFRRVLRPGGEIVLANHFGMESGPIAAIEHAVAPLVRRMGWSSEFKLQRIRQWADGAGFSVAEVVPAFPLGFFRVVRLKDRRTPIVA